ECQVLISCPGSRRPQKRNSAPGTLTRVPPSKLRNRRPVKQPNQHTRNGGAETERRDRISLKMISLLVSASLLLPVTSVPSVPSVSVSSVTSVPVASVASVDYDQRYESRT